MNSPPEKKQNISNKSNINLSQVIKFLQTRSTFLKCLRAHSPEKKCMFLFLHASQDQG